MTISIPMWRIEVRSLDDYGRVMIERGVIGLRCDSPAHRKLAQPPALAELGFRAYDAARLRKEASELGWVSVPLPGAPWHVQDFCPDHPPEDHP